MKYLLASGFGPWRHVGEHLSALPSTKLLPASGAVQDGDGIRDHPCHELVQSVR